MEVVITKEHWKTARIIKKYYSIYKENEEMFRIGTYIKGNDEEVDKAKAIYPKIQAILRQEMDEKITLDEVLLKMKELVDEV